METYDVLSDDELAAVVAGVDIDRTMRERLGWCGCGLAHAVHTAS